MPTISTNPTEDLRKQAGVLDQRADTDEQGLLAREDALAKERQQQMQALQQKRSTAIGGYDAAAADMQKTLQQPPEQVPMPKTDLGPPIDPGTFKDFMYGMMTLALIGSVGGRSHYMGAMEALNGSLQGFREGNMELAKEKKEQFEREYKEAQAKQGEADKRYQRILEDKKLTLNMKAEQLRIASVEFEDWDMNAKATQHDFDGMHRRIDSNRKRADGMKTLASKLDEQAMFKQMAADTKKGKDAAGKLPDETLQFMAKQYLSGDKSVFQNLGRGAQGAENVTRLRTFITEAAFDQGMTPAQLTTKLAEFEGLKASMRTLGTREANMETAAYEAHSFADLALDAAAKVQRTDFVPVNKLIEKVQEGTASPEQRQFVVANRSLINAYAQVVARTGAKNIHDTVEAEKMLFTADGAAAYKAGVDQLKKEITTALKAPRATREAIEERAGGAAPSRRAGDKTFASEAEASAAAQRGELKTGDRVTIGGQSGTWQ